MTKLDCRKGGLRTALMACTGLVSLTMGSHAAMAQTAETQDEAAAKAEREVPAIIVTGSRIRGIEANGSNVIALGQEQIEDVPVASTTELLRTLPQNISLGTAEAVGGGGTEASQNQIRSNGINLRGLGGSATLTLVDGYRNVPMGIFGNFVDPSGIPTLALERVEVVADGASAIYGSDAVAGVVNLITRTKFEGFEAMGRYGFADGGYEETQFGVIGGVGWSTGNVVLAFERQYKEALTPEGRRDFLTADQTAFGGGDFRSLECAPGNVRVGDTFYPLPATGGTLSAGAPNRCEPTYTIVPEVTRHTGYAAFNQEIGDNVDLFARGFISDRDSPLQYRQSATVTVPNTNPFFVSPDPSVTSVVVSYDYTDEAGFRGDDVGESIIQGTAGLRARILDGWQAEVAVNIGKSKIYIERYTQVNSRALAAAAADSNPDTALNPFSNGLGNNPATLDSVFNGIFLVAGGNEMRAVDVQLDGPLFALPGGDVRVALGGEHRWERNYTDFTVGTLANPFPAGTFDENRTVDSVFGEIYIPFFGGNNAQPGLEELSLSIAGRYEKYSDVGSTTNPKVTLDWMPVDGLRFKASYGTSFRAPYLPEANFRSGGFGIYPGERQDPLSPTGVSNGITISGGNPDLKPATATTYSVGLDWRPPSIDGLNINLFYFNVDYKDEIFLLQSNPLVLVDPAYAPFITRNPTQDQINDALNFDGSPVPVLGPLPPTIDFIVDGRRQNVGQTKLSGIDFGINYMTDSGIGELMMGLAGTYNIKMEQSVAPGAPFRDVLDTLNFPLTWRLRGTLGWNSGPWSSNVFVTHTNGYENNLAGDFPIDSHTVVDMRVGRDFEISNATFNLGVTVNNLFDSNPPHTNTQLGYDPYNADARGRLVSVQLRMAL